MKPHLRSSRPEKPQERSEPSDMTPSKRAVGLPRRVGKHLRAFRLRIVAEREANRAFSDPAVPPVLVYTMGKVGSTTVCHSLREAVLPNPVLPLHFLSADLSRHRKTHEYAGIYPPPYHIFLGEAVRKALPRPCSVISLVRDPVAFVVSDLFENPAFAREAIRTGNGTIDSRKALGYLQQELANPRTFSYVNEWFDRELKQVFHIDVFAEPFPVDVGYAAYSKGDVKALVIRLEDLSRVGPTAISEFLDLAQPVTLASANVRKESEQAEAYDQVLHSIELDAALCRQIYASEFVTHFYNETMIERFRSKWTGSMPQSAMHRDG